MTLTAASALDLRLEIGNIFSGDDPPPGAARAAALLLDLRRHPDDAEVRQRARDLLAAVALRARLVDYRDHAQRIDAPRVALLAHGLIGHADAELLGGTAAPGWRAAALDLLEPDDEHRDPLDRDTALRLLTLALRTEDADDAAGS